MKFAWVTLVVNNFDETLEFYTNVLGLYVIRTYAIDNGSYRVVFLGDHPENIQLQIIEKNDLKTVNMGKMITLNFEVESLDATIKHLESKNVSIHTGPIQPSSNIKFILVVDPNGLKIQFSEIMAKK